MEQEQLEQQRKLVYIADQAIREVFADSIHSIMFDGANFRIEFTIGRQGSTTGEVGTRHPVARLVMPLPAATELATHLHRVLEDLQQRGAVRRRDSEVGPNRAN